MSTTSRAVSSTPVTHRASPERIMARYPVRPLEALRAMRALIDNPDDTTEVFRVIRALAGRNFEKLFARTMADPTGARILEERKEWAGLVEIWRRREGRLRRNSHAPRAARK